MKKLLLLFIPVILLGAGCSTGTNQISSMPSIDQQAKCATQAEKVLEQTKKDPNSTGFINYMQTNHFNQKLNKCLVLIGSDSNSTGTHYESLSDAFENTLLAMSSWNYQIGNDGQGKYSNEQYLIDDKNVSKDVYNKFVDDKMETGK